MKSAISVHLAGILFHIDEDAYLELKNYLDLIEMEIDGLEGKQEIYTDIEARIAELFRERITSYKQVVNIKDVNEIIRIMGKPEEISGNGGTTSFRVKNTQRRMYRNPDERILGGVCSGIAAYWQVDVVLIRVIFVILAIFGMAGVLIYIILWIVVPEASTVTQKLEMRGQAVNIHSIIDFFKEEFEYVKKGFKKS